VTKLRRCLLEVSAKKKFSVGELSLPLNFQRAVSMSFGKLELLLNGERQMKNSNVKPMPKRGPGIEW
jgi:hypothetical protein